MPQTDSEELTGCKDCDGNVIGGIAVNHASNCPQARFPDSIDELHAACVHHYRLDQENYGICKKCGAERQFVPAIPDSYREYGTVCSNWQEVKRLVERVAGNVTVW